MNLRLFFLIFSAAMVMGGRQALAQDSGYRFTPPRPPPLDGGDFDEGDEDDPIEMGEDFRPPPMPPAGSVPGGAPPAPGAMPSAGGGGDFRPSGSFGETTPGNFRFKVVDGDYWEKGKRRTRGQGTRVSSGSGGGSSRGN